MTNGTQNVELFVTHANACGPFLKIWGQINHEESRRIESTINRLRPRFERFEGAITPQTFLKCGSICCAFHEDNYYRAKIITLNPDCTIHVHFIDYGNAENVLPTAIRLLDCFNDGLELITLPPIAHDFTVIQVMPFTSSWNDNIVGHIKQILSYKEHHAIVTFPSKQLISLSYNGGDFADYLLSKNMAIPSIPEERQMIARVCEQSMYQQHSPPDMPYNNRINNNYSMPPKLTVNNYPPQKLILQKNWRQPQQSSIPQQPPVFTPPPTRLEQSHGFINPVLEKDSIQQVTISHIVDGPLVFSVQMQSRAQELETLMKNINNYPLQSLSQRADIATVCLARESKHNTIRRAVVMYVGDPRAAKLFYVDYGDSETLSHSCIYDIPPQFIKPLALSVRFSLSGLSDVVVTKEMKHYFEELVKNKVLTVKIQPEEFHSPLMSFGIFYLDGKNILDMLREAFPDSAIKWPERRQLLTSSRNDVQISYIEACNKFFVQLIAETPMLNILAREISEHVKIAPELKSVETGIKCLARSAVDLQWYRAEILNVTDNEVLVYYVDYGNDEKIPRTDLRSIRNENITKVPPLAIQCILVSFDGIPFDAEIYEKFEESVLNKIVVMMVHEVKSHALIVELYDTSKKPIVNISAMLRNTSVSDANPNIKPTHWHGENNVTVAPNPRTKRSSVKTQPLLGQQNKAKLKSVKPIREENDRWAVKSQGDPRQQSCDNSFDNQKISNWQNSQNDDKRFSNQEQKSVKGWMNSQKNDRFNRDNSRNERYNRDSNSRYEKNDTNEWFDSDGNSNNYTGKDSRGGRENRGGKGKGYSPNTSRSERNNSVEKDSWSDKDSNSSSRGGSGRRGGSRGAARGVPRNGNSNRSRRDIGSENDRLYKPPRSSGFNTRATSGASRFNDRRSNERNEDNAVAQIDTWNSVAPSTSNKKDTNAISRIPPPNITLGAVKHCEIVYVISPSEFYVQLCPDNVELDNVMIKIANIYETGGTILPESNAKIGDGCIAQYSEDSTWYRAVIQSIESAGATVQFVDYGNTELVPFNKIKILEKEFANLATQAIRCKLLAAGKTEWDVNEINRITAISDLKPLEAEFVAEENNIYEVLLRHIVDGIPKNSYINEEFSDGADLMQAKEIARNRSRSVPPIKIGVVIPRRVADYAPLNQKWGEPPIYFDKAEEVIITWLTNPNNFYAQFVRNQKEFRAMMDSIQKVYIDAVPTNESRAIGSSVIAVFPEDLAFYRAEIIQILSSTKVFIRYVDFGNCAVVKPCQLFNVEKQFMILPKQAVNCSLKNIVPPGKTADWSSSNSQEMDQLFNIDKLQCIFHKTTNDKCLVTLMNNGENLADKMVERGIADFETIPSNSNLSTINSVNYSNVSEHLAAVDISRLTGQSLRVKVSNVESVDKFHIQLPSAETSEKIITDFMANNDSQVMPKLSECEVCLGAGCLVQTYDGWKRAVVINCSQTTGIDVRFIDSGAIEMIPSDRMVALPGKLSLMQKQAIECCLKNVSSSTDNNEKLKSLIENKEVIMKVEDVNQNRLVVNLFDEAGKKIRITAKEINENICPLLPMPILYCEHRMTVSHINHSGSVWLKRLADVDINQVLIDELYDYYIKSGKPLNIIPGTLCAAQSADGNWYRARIIEKTEKGAVVHYMDYGNTEEIESNSLKQLDPRFVKQSELAIESSLTVTINDTEEKQKEILDIHLLDKEVTASIYRIDNKWIAEIMLSSELKLTDFLSSLGILKSQIVPDVTESDDLVTRNKFKISVCHTENPAQFWIQRLTDSSALDSLQEKLQTEALNYEIINGVPEEKSLCAALCSVDKMWYRAEVIDADEEMVTLRFIDYGNTDTILDLANGMKHLPNDMKSIAPYAIKCRLDLIPSGDDWSEEASMRFKSLISNASVDAVIISEGNPTRVELFVNENTVSDILVKENHAMKLQANEELIDEVVELVLDPKSAFVSHINSLSEFWVQEEKSVANLELIADRFLVADMFPKVDNIKEGQLCVAKFPDDMSWYRARIISHGDDGTNVIYIDYGNSAISTEIRAIPEDVAAIPPLSRKCCLPLPEGVEKWSEDACQKFIEMADEGATIFLLDVLEEGETSTVKLTYKGSDILDELVQLCEKLNVCEITSSTLSCMEETNSEISHINEFNIDDVANKETIINDNIVENEIAVYVSQINSPCEFWIQEERSTDKLNKIANSLLDVSSFEQINESNVVVGDLCIAEFLDDLVWYRAQIISNDNTGINVFFIDYGNSTIVTNIRKISDDLAAIPPLSKKCSLVLPTEIPQWSDKATEEFFKLGDEGTTKFIMNILEESETSLVKLTLNNEDISSQLADLCQKDVPVIEERLPPLGEENSPNVVVSHVVSPTEFWIQAESKIPELQIIAHHLDNATSFLPITSLKEGTICAAEFPDDGQWYRAKILSHNLSKSEVLYIDYGNSAVSSQIKALPEDIMTMPPLSKLCALKMPEGVEFWSKEACEKFIDLVAEGATVFEYKELHGSEPTYVSLQLNGQDVITILSPLCKITVQSEIDSVSYNSEESEKIQVNKEQCIDIDDSIEIQKSNEESVEHREISEKTTISKSHPAQSPNESCKENSAILVVDLETSFENSTSNCRSDKIETETKSMSNTLEEAITGANSSSNLTTSTDESITNNGSETLFLLENLDSSPTSTIIETAPVSNTIEKNLNVNEEIVVKESISESKNLQLDVNVNDIQPTNSQNVCEIIENNDIPKSPIITKTEKTIDDTTDDDTSLMSNPDDKLIEVESVSTPVS